MTAFPPINGFDPPPLPTTLGDEAGSSMALSAMDLLNSYAHIFMAAFLLTLFVTPIVRRLALRAGVVDHPDPRKVHRTPTAYLGGVAVFLGILFAIMISYVFADDRTFELRGVPMAVVIGMVAITFTGLADDLWGWDPRLKIAGQLVAAAALALEDVGVNVARGLLMPLIGAPEDTFIAVAGLEMYNHHVFYWVGTALIAIFVLGGCNSANLIDGLDGLLSGVVAIAMIGLLAICLLVATDAGGGAGAAAGTDSLAGARIVLCIATLGAVLGFLPHNFNPASIFLGDAGSLLLGYMCIVIIIMLGDQGQTHLVFAGLIVIAVPGIDTTLAIIRRKMAGQPMSAPDDQHIHHQLKRNLGGVKKAVFALYGMGFCFAVVGFLLVVLVLNGLRVRFIYAIAIVLFSFVGVIAVKEARRQQKVAAEAKRAARKAVAPASKADTASGIKPDVAKST